MISYKITYSVKKSEKNHVIELINEFIDGIRNNEPDTIIYHAVQDSLNSTEFIHVMTFRNEHAEVVHKDSSYCHKFTEELFPLCITEPEYSPINLIR